MSNGEKKIATFIIQSYQLRNICGAFGKLIEFSDDRTLMLQAKIGQGFQFDLNNN